MGNSQPWGAVQSLEHPTAHASEPPLNVNYTQFCPALWRQITSKEQQNRGSDHGAMSQRVLMGKVKGSLQVPTL